MSDFEVTYQACGKCGVVMPITEFPKHSQYKTGYDTRCKPCIKHAGDIVKGHKKLYSGTEPMWFCWMCGSTEEAEMRYDHDHITNEFRGCLCDRCNVGFGLMGDGEFVIEHIQRYLAYKGHFTGERPIQRDIALPNGDGKKNQDYPFDIQSFLSKPGT